MPRPPCHPLSLLFPNLRHYSTTDSRRSLELPSKKGKHLLHLNIFSETIPDYSRAQQQPNHRVPYLYKPRGAVATLCIRYMVRGLPKPCCLVYFATRISAYLRSSSVNNGGFPLLEENNGQPEYRGMKLGELFSWIYGRVRRALETTFIRNFAV